MPNEIRYHSRIGSPAPAFTNPVYPAELQTGDLLGLFTAPYPIQVVPELLFAKFGLWHSSAGVMTPGPVHTPLKIYRNSITTTTPPLAGDSCQGAFISDAIVRYDDTRRVWISKIELVRVMPTARPVAAEQYAFLAALADALSKITAAGAAVRTLADAIIGNLKAAQSPPGTAGGPLVTAAFEAAVLADRIAAQKAVTEAEAALTTLAAKEWRP
jgi:hypothetical protein